MTLRPTGPFLTRTETGVVLALYAGDLLYDFEIQRAPDVAGAPGTYVTIASDVPGYTELYTDRLAANGATRWYRIRHTGFGDTPSAWVGPVSAVPAIIPGGLSRPPLGPPLSLHVVRSAAVDGQITVEAYVADPSPTSGVPITLRVQFDGVSAVLPESATLTAPGDPITADLETTDFVEFVITQAPAGSAQGRVSIIADRPGRRSAVQSIDVLPRDTYAIPIPLIGTITAEASAGDDPAGYGMVHIPLTFSADIAEYRIFAAEADTAGVATPDSTIASTSAALRRQEGVIESADDWSTMQDIATTAGSYRKLVILAVGPTGLQSDPDITELQAVDTGTGPSGGPTGIGVVMSTVGDAARATVSFTIVDAAAEHRVFRNGTIVAILVPTDNVFVDDGLAPDRDYRYDVDAFLSGQTSGMPAAGTGTAPVPTLSAPTWAVGYPDGFMHHGSIPAVAIRVGSVDPLARTVIYRSASNLDASFSELEEIPAGETDRMVTEPSPATHYFYLVARRAGYTDSVGSTHYAALYGG